MNQQPTTLSVQTTCWLICLTVTLSSSASGRTINVADHGIVPGKDVTFQVNRLIESVQGESDVTLVFPKGTYDFHPENAVKMYRAVANHDNGLKRMAFPLFNCRNITIDGGGSLFLFHGRLIPVTIETCTDATLKNFSIDWIRSFHSELTVVESNADEKSFVVEADPAAYPYTIQGGEIRFHRFGQDDPIGSNILIDPQTRAPVVQTKSYSVNGRRAKVTAAGNNRIRFENAVKKAPPVGTVLVVYGVHPTSRLCHAIQVTNSKDVRVENVTVHDAGGMALIVERTENVTLDHMVVTSNAERLVATRADATHFIGCRGTIRLENCLFEHMLDDGINVHGAYVKVAEYLGDQQFLCEISHFQQWGLTFAEPGDKVAFLSRETVLPFFQATVKDVRILNEHRFVITVADVPDELPDGPLSVENLAWYPDLVMKNNTIRENRARSVLVTTKGKVLIEGNHFSSQMNGILIEGDNNKWYESGAVQDVTIRNNVFVNSGFGSGPVYPLLASPLLTAEQRMGEGHYHRNIRFVNNTLRSFDGRLVKAASVSGLAIAGNKVEFSRDYPAVSDLPAVDLTYCSDVSITGNTVTGFDRALNVRQSANTESVTIKDNKGLKATKSQSKQATTP